MSDYQQLLDSNAEIVRKKLAEDPDFFEKLSKGQQPKFLWIGCSDSRVPANEVTGTHAGDIFVHRNIANLVNNTDLNLMSVLAYAVGVLKVDHVIVCGHYGCGGVITAMSHQDVGIINKWVRDIKDTYANHWDELKDLGEQERFDRMVELNVQEQVNNLAKSTIMQHEWKEREVHIHGWVYDLKTGRIKDLGIDVSDSSGLPEVYRLDL